MLFTSGPTTIGPGIVVDSDLRQPIRTHHHIFNNQVRHHANSCSFYNQLSKRLSDASVILDLFACSLDQVGAAELRQPVEQSGGFMILSESFESDQFKKCLGHMFKSPLSIPLLNYVTLLTTHHSLPFILCFLQFLLFSLKNPNSQFPQSLLPSRPVARGSDSPGKMSTQKKRAFQIEAFRQLSQINATDRTPYGRTSTSSDHQTDRPPIVTYETQETALLLTDVKG
ncbi:protein transport protein sec23-1-like [Vigna angularis]|uniref:protein transport protein sec23-1-like n=1 Tax=Phaseolus angularis TaxID=3914 RepID=UPI0022B49224|nr:protein transport protein sec23-1-like [Vigna angularis]